MSSLLKEGALTYCNYRITIGSILSIICAISIIYIAYYYYQQASEQSDYFQTRSTVTSGDIEKIKSGNKYYYLLKLNYKYMINNYEYTGSADEYIYKTYEEAEDALNVYLNEAKILPVYVNPLNVSDSIIQKKSAPMASLSSSCAFILIFVAVLLYIYRKNPIVCGITIFEDIINLLK